MIGLLSYFEFLPFIGNYIKTFSSAQEAAEAVHVDASNIRKNCNQYGSW